MGVAIVEYKFSFSWERVLTHQGNIPDIQMDIRAHKKNTVIFRMYIIYVIWLHQLRLNGIVVE